MKVNIDFAEYITVIEFEPFLGEDIKKYQKDCETIRNEKERVKREKDKQDKYAGYVEIVNNFIAGGTTSIKDFLEENEIHPKHFEEIVSLIREKNLELYDEYTKKLLSQSRQRFVPVLENAQRICKLIIEGVEEEDDVRPFDYLDFRLSTRMTLDEFIDFVKKQKLLKTPTEIRTVMQFKSKNTAAIPTVTTNQQIFNEKHVIGGREVALPIKKAIVAYLEDYGITNDYRAYKMALTRFLDRKLDLTDYYKEPFDEEAFFNSPKIK